MDIQPIVQTITERLQNSASVKTIYGEPISAGGRTIIPVAKIAYGFGGGSHGGENADSGGGGGVAAKPVGVLEVTPETTRYISLGMEKTIIGAVVAGVFLGLLLGKRLHRQ
ncbi:MAG: spore germination protein GerW family protein [Nitrospirota bacterium]